MMSLPIPAMRTGDCPHCSQPDKMSAVPDLDLETILLELPRPRRPPEPHPDLVASINPTARQMIEAAAVLGWLPGGDANRV